MKRLGAQWMVALYEHLTDNPHVIVNGFRHAGVCSALGLLNDDDTNLSYYSEMSAVSDYELNDDQQSPGDGEISDSEEDISHGNQAIYTTPYLSAADVFTCSEDSNSD